eukprot:1930966-Rhodomonas_salina.2
MESILQYAIWYAIGLRACYAVSSTDMPYGSIGLRACYAMSGTDLPCGATRTNDLLFPLYVIVAVSPQIKIRTAAFQYSLYQARGCLPFLSQY